MFGAAAPPIYQTSTHTFENWDALSNAFDDRINTPFYGRQLNPTVQLTEQVLAFGRRRTGSVIWLFWYGGNNRCSIGQPKPVIIWWPSTAFMVSAGRFPSSWLPQKAGVTTSFVSAMDCDAFVQVHVANPGDLLETPSSGHFELQDIAGIAEAVQDRDIRIIVDNTWATPLRQWPPALGAHLEIHSASKNILAATATLIAGVLLGNAELIEAITNDEAEPLGARLAPQNAGYCCGDCARCRCAWVPTNAMG